MEISLIGINYRTAPVELREQLCLGDAQAVQLMHTMRAEHVFDEVLVLDTCNRTEIYFVTGQSENPLEHLLAHIGKIKDTRPPGDPGLYYHHRGLEAAAHLFRVAASLDSLIVGEDEILGQVKKAYSLALAARSSRFLLNKLMHRAFRVGKRVRTETELNRGASSVPQAAVELARQIFSSLEGKRVLLVGAGQMAELAARALLRAGAGSLIVANRTLSRAQQLADQLREDPSEKKSAQTPSLAGELAASSGCPALEEENSACTLDEPQRGPAAYSTQAIELNQIPSIIAEVDLVICSTGAQDFVLRREDLAEALSRLKHSLLIIDIAVPRDVDPRLGEFSNVFAYNIDQMKDLVEENIERRRMEIPRAEAIVEMEVGEFGKWLESLQVIPTIKLLQERIESLQQEHIQKYGKQFGPEQYQQLRQYTRTLCNKFMHKPISYLRELSNNHLTSDDLAMMDMIRQMFKLDTEERAD